MINSDIQDHATLISRIAELRVDRSIQESRLKKSFEQFTGSLSPVSLIKESIKRFSQNEELGSDILKSGLNLGANFIIEKVLGRSRTLKGFFGSILAEKVSTPLINTTVTKMLAGKGKQKTGKSDQDDPVI